ncbi:chaperone protein HtpG [Rodentibacter pneumotropicus]|uniref:Chaperone protein HtpG n=1 Tax=Rodentibacter pneumotropicus TaxID=758 RepID=A0A448MMG5_9PAST|nr:chaperone protein HtpG [Rodentibacter pneumotropicus]
MLSYLTEFDGKPLQTITKADLDLGDLADKDEAEQKSRIKPLKVLLNV